MNDWGRCIDVNRKDLLPMVAGILGMLGDGGTVRRFVYLAILAVLRPAESILRRLIAIAAKDIVVKPRAKRGPPSGAIPKGKGGQVPSFPLFDPRRYAGPPKGKKVPGFGPNIRGFDEYDVTPPSRTAISADDPINAAALRRRIEALLAAMENIPAQARRLARKLARMERPVRAMRPGRPPGFCDRGKRPIDLLLADCHQLALMALAEAKAPP